MSHVDATDGEIAQLVERRTHKPKVKGSIPFLATIFFKQFSRSCGQFSDIQK